MTNTWTPGQRILLGDALQARRRALLRGVETHQEGLSRVEHASAVLQQDADGTAQHASDREVDLVLSDRDAQALQSIEHALSTLADDRFGLCRDCGEAIPFDRLRVEPDAVRCVDCQTRAEQHMA